MTEVVARADELRALGEFLDGPVDSAGALVLEGEAGVGKTTLFRAALELAAERSLRVLSTSRPGQRGSLQTRVSAICSMACSTRSCRC